MPLIDRKFLLLPSMVKLVCFLLLANSIAGRGPQPIPWVYWKYPTASLGISIEVIGVAAVLVLAKMHYCGPCQQGYLVSYSIGHFSARQLRIVTLEDDLSCDEGPRDFEAPDLSYFLRNDVLRQ